MEILVRRLGLDPVEVELWWPGWFVMEVASARAFLPDLTRDEANAVWEAALDAATAGVGVHLENVRSIFSILRSSTARAGR